MAENLKVSTCSQEILRRWKTTSEYCYKDVYENITREYIDDLAGMGYTPQWRQKVLTSTIRGNSHLLRRCEIEEATRNRVGADTFIKRRFNKLCGNQTWFRMSSQYQQRLEEVNHGLWEENHRRHRDNRYIEAVMFIPYTPESQLKSRLSALESKLGFRAKYRYVEQAGRTLSQMIVRKDPVGGPCGRPKCFPCQTKGGTA